MVLQISRAAGDLAFALSAKRGRLALPAMKPNGRARNASSHRRRTGSLVELAIETSASKIPAIHLARLGMLGHVLIGPEGPLLVTGVGLIRITK